MNRSGVGVAEQYMRPSTKTTPSMESRHMSEEHTRDDERLGHVRSFDICLSRIIEVELR